MTTAAKQQLDQQNLIMQLQAELKEKQIELERKQSAKSRADKALQQTVLQLGKNSKIVNDAV